jgi:transposase
MASLEPNASPRRGSRRRRGKSTSPTFPVVQPNAAGIDVGAREVWVAVPAQRCDEPVRCFETFTVDLQELARWLKELRITTVAMESTGVYWIPLYQILEAAGFEVCLVNARHVQKVPGRKSDVTDCQWLQRLHEAGLLQASFRPPEEICALRSILRHRANLVGQAASHLQAMQKALMEMNIQLHHVLSDLAGTSGLRILDAILAGERDPASLAALREASCKTELDKVLKALQGDWRSEHLFVLRQAREAFRYVHSQLAECDQEVARVLAELDGVADPNQAPPRQGPKQRPRKNQFDLPNTDLRLEMFRLFGTDLTLVPGLGIGSLVQLYSELGADLSAFPSAKHFCSWLALCPGNRRSGGKVLSSRTRPVKHRVATIFRLAVQALHHSDCWLGRFLRQVKARLGKAEGTTAAAHRLARVFYYLVTTGVPYDESHYQRKHDDQEKRELKQLARKAAAKGLVLVPKASVH